MTYDYYKKEYPQVSIYAVPGLIYPMKPIRNKKRITEAIAEAWDIPEDKVLGSTMVTEKVWPGAGSFDGERVRVPGEKKREYANARKFYFYVMVEIKKYSFKFLTQITGRKIAAMKWASRRASEHMNLEKGFQTRAEMVLTAIKADEIIFPEEIINIEANARIIERGGNVADPPEIQLPETGG